MAWSTPTLLIVGGLILAFFGVRYFRRKDMVKAVGFGLAVVGVLAYAGYVSIAPLSAQLGLQDVSPSTSTAATSLGGTPLPVDTAAGVVKEKESNSYSAVDGLLQFYEPTQNPRDPNTNPIVSMVILNGAGTDTTGKLRTNTQYRTLFKNTTGSPTAYYSEDLGVIVPYPEASYNKQTGKATFFVEGDHAVRLPATIDDMLTEATNANANINGGNFTSQGTECNESSEVASNGTDKLYYDESFGDASWYFDPLISLSGGANRASRGLVLQHQWDAANPPGGDEVTACSLSLISGQNPSLPSDCLGAWKNQAKIALFNGAEVPAGTLSRIRITYTVSEANWNNPEIWNLCLADLGGRNELDIGLGAGAADDCIAIDTCA